MRVVVDTNTVVSALLWRGSPYRLFQTVNDDRISLYTSRVLLDEFEAGLSRRRFVKASGQKQRPRTAGVGRNVSIFIRASNLCYYTGGEDLHGGWAQVKCEPGPISFHRQGRRHVDESGQGREHQDPMTRAATAGEHVEIAPMKTGCALLLLALGAAFPIANAQTEKWPDKPVRVMVPGAPGGTSDVIARLLAPRLTEEFGQQFIIDNRPGAGGSIAAAIAARATPDGYTIAEVTSSYSAFAALHPLPYDPVKGIAPITMIGIVPFILVVHPSVKASNVGEFIELARSQPGALAFGSSGIGGTPHLAFALLQQMTRTHMHHVPYKSEPTSIADLIGGQIQARISTGLSLGPHISTGKLRALAVTTERRSPAMPDLPAISEWVPGYAVDGWSGIWAPAGTPRKIVARLNQALARILKLPDVQERLRAVGMDPAPFAPEEFARVIARDIAMWTKVVKAANIKIE